EGEGVDASPVGQYERVASDIKGLRAAIERLERGRDIFGAPNFECRDIEAERAGRRLNLVHLQCGNGITDIRQAGQPAETGDDLAQEFESLASKIGVRADRPVTLPPGRARLAIRPVPTGSPITAETIGMTPVACFAAMTGGVAYVTMTSTLSRTNSAAISARRSLRPSAQRYSTATVRPSVHPSSRSRCAKAATHWLMAKGVLGPKKPMVGSFADCARVTTGHIAAAPPISVMNSRRPIIRSPRRRGRATWAAPSGRAPWRSSGR